MASLFSLLLLLIAVSLIVYAVELIPLPVLPKRLMEALILIAAAWWVLGRSGFFRA